MFIIFFSLLLSSLRTMTFPTVDQRSLRNDFSITEDPFEIHTDQMIKISLTTEKALIREQSKDIFEISPCNLLLPLYGDFDSK